MADFQTAVTLTLIHEGGYVDDKDDRGGETNFGISKLQYPHEDIKGMTRERAIEIYKHDYWRREMDTIKDQGIANKVFDMGVLTSPRRALRFLQTALCSCGHDVPIDGAWGPRTITAINTANPKELMEAFQGELAKYYTWLAEAAPVNAKFLKGWLNRVNA